jgi:hypothetical protein
LNDRHVRPLLTILLILVFALPSFAAEPIAASQPDLTTVTRIRQEGFRNSKVMEILSELTDRLGARLTGSANLKKANEWTRDQLTAYGLTNAHLESFTFGRGWAMDSVSVRMTAPDVAPLYALPKAWTPAVSVKGEVVRLSATTIDDLAKEKGKYSGKIVLVGELRELQPQAEAALRRYDEDKLRDLGGYQIPGSRPQDPVARAYSREEMIKRFQFSRALQKFLEEEKVACSIEQSRGDAGLIFVQGTQNYKLDSPDGVPQLVMSAEHFNRIARLLDRKVPVTLDIDVKSHFETTDGGKVFNTIAEIPGTDKKDEIVLAGGHIDSWHGGTGATDNAAGVAAVMEAVRIINALGLKPRRTIRVGLWSGEEQGLLGSKAYATDHLGQREEGRPATADGVPSYLRDSAGNYTLTLKPEQQKLAVYFNIDNGTGRLRGIYTQENAAVRPIFERWGEPFRDLGFTTVTMRNTGGTDHQSFDAVGIPAFQFVQDPVEYDSRTHHSNMDVYDRIQRDDMMQSAVILASFLYNAAMTEDMLPRKPFTSNVKVVK